MAAAGGGAAAAAGRAYSFKVVLLGEGCVGKTSLVLRYCENKFNDKHITTLQVQTPGNRARDPRPIAPLPLACQPPQPPAYPLPFAVALGTRGPRQPVDVKTRGGEGKDPEKSPVLVEAAQVGESPVCGLVFPFDGLLLGHQVFSLSGLWSALLSWRSRNLDAD